MPRSAALPPTSEPVAATTRSTSGAPLSAVTWRVAPPRRRSARGRRAVALRSGPGRRDTDAAGRRSRGTSAAAVPRVRRATRRGRGGRRRGRLRSSRYRAKIPVSVVGGGDGSSTAAASGSTPESRCQPGVRESQSRARQVSQLVIARATRSPRRARLGERRRSLVLLREDRREGGEREIPGVAGAGVALERDVRSPTSGSPSTTASRTTARLSARGSMTPSG